jgi:colanic acid/amylovoran biosynthesis glycosyltransferase
VQRLLSNFFSGLQAVGAARNRGITPTKKPSQLRLAYITDIFPAVSLTFIYLELKRLRHLQLDITFYAIWKGHPGTTSQEADILSNETIYLSPPSLTALLRSHCYYFGRAPYRYLVNLRLCLILHPSIRLYRRTVYDFLLAPYFAEILKKNHTSHIHAHFAFGAATVAMMAARLLNISFSFTAHGSDVLIEPSLLNEKLKSAKFAIAISEYNKNCLIRQGPGVDNDKVKVIHCGIDPDVFYPVRYTTHQKPLFLAVGNLVDQKGHAYLIEACRALAMDGLDFRCTIVGDGPRRQDLERLITRYKFGEKVELAGAIPHEHIQPYFDRTDIVVHPSLSEGIPVVLMEAMSKGLPVIATRITGIPELIRHEENGVLVCPGNVAELAEAMKSLSSNTELRTKLGRNARKKIVEDFNLDVNARKIKKLFEEEILYE